MSEFVFRFHFWLDFDALNLSNAITTMLITFSMNAYVLSSLGIGVISSHEHTYTHALTQQKPDDTYRRARTSPKQGSQVCCKIFFLSLSTSESETDRGCNKMHQEAEKPLDQQSTGTDRGYDKTYQEAREATRPGARIPI